MDRETFVSKIRKLIYESKNFLNNASHLLNVTYPVIKDGKFLIAVLENLFLSASQAIEALLLLERAYKNIPPFHNTFDSKYRVFFQYCVPKYNIDKRLIQALLEVKDILIFHKQGSVVFSKENKYIIWDNEYNSVVLNDDKVKYYYELLKKLILTLHSLVENHDGLSRLYGRSSK